MTDPRRGEIWWGEIEGVGRRPCLVMTRSAAIPVLHSVLAAPVTRTIRNIVDELVALDGEPMGNLVRFGLSLARHLASGGSSRS